MERVDSMNDQTAPAKMSVVEAQQFLAKLADDYADKAKGLRAAYDIRVPGADILQAKANGLREIVGLLETRSGGTRDKQEGTDD